MLITGRLSFHAKQQAEKIAIFTEKGSITYGELFWQVNGIAAYLSHCRQNPGEEQPKLALLLPNSIEFLCLFLGAAQAGWIAVPLDAKWSGKELEHVLAECRPNVIAVHESHVKHLSSIPMEAELLMIKEGEFRVEQEKRYSADVSDQTLFYMGFTSGTTGTPKGFLRSHRSWVKSFEGSRIEFGIDARERVLVPGPLVHSHFLYAAVQALFAGAMVYLLEKFSPGKVLDWISRYPATVLYLVPTMGEALLKELANRTEPLARNQVRALISSGAKWSAESKANMTRWFPQGGLYEFYGASELSYVTVLGPEGNRSKPDSVGRPFHGVKISIRDQQGREVAPGDVGKLFVQSEFVFSGYYQREVETKSVLVDGWATVHDLAKRDEDGYIYLVGREKNMLIYGGLNIYPEEVEKVLKQLPQIEEAVVLGKPDPYWGHIPVAVIRLVPGAQLAEKDIRAHCRRHLSGYKCPRQIIEWAELPYTTSGKVARQTLASQLFPEGVKQG